MRMWQNHERRSGSSPDSRVRQAVVGDLPSVGSRTIYPDWISSEMGCGKRLPVPFLYGWTQVSTGPGDLSVLGRRDD